jgi:hypothetical protein
MLGLLNTFLASVCIDCTQRGNSRITAGLTPRGARNTTYAALTIRPCRRGPATNRLYSVDALCPVLFWGAGCLDWSIVTRARAPRQCRRLVELSLSGVLSVLI